MSSPLVVFSAPPACPLGTVIDGRYALQRVIGDGASSWVFAATDQRLDREVALKLFKPASSDDDAKRRAWCTKEGRTLAKLVHPHIVAIHDASEDSSSHSYLVMELCESATLEAELAQRGRLGVVETLDLIVPLMGALAIAHDRDIVHRDVKPANIVLLRESGLRHCKLLDFGIALNTGLGTATGLAVGTPSFMAPEQARGEPPTPASDVWALGVVLFRCLSGSLPFSAESPASLLRKITSERAPCLSRVWDAANFRNLSVAVDRALEPNVERRYAGVRAFAHAIAAACALDDLPVRQRPEPLGLPDFDRWLTNAKVTEATQELPSGALDPNGRRDPKRGGARQKLTIAVLASLGLGGVWVGGSRSNDPLAPATRDIDACVVPRAITAGGAPTGRTSEGTSRPMPVPVVAAPPRPAVQHEHSSTQHEEAAVAGATQAGERHPPSKRRAPAPRTAASAASSPRILMDWDW